MTKELQVTIFERWVKLYKEKGGSRLRSMILRHKEKFPDLASDYRTIEERNGISYR